MAASNTDTEIDTGTTAHPRSADPELHDWILAEGQRRGNAVIQVPPDEQGPGFCFTACAWAMHGVPEAVVVGLPAEMATVLLDAYVDRVSAGETFEFGTLYRDFFEGVPITFEEVAQGHYPQYFGAAFLIYPDGDFPAVQIIVPTAEGAWPWQPEAPRGFAAWQPVLTESGHPQSWTPGVNGP